MVVYGSEGGNQKGEFIIGRHVAIPCYYSFITD